MGNKRFPRYIDDADYTTNAPSYYKDLGRKNKLIEKLAKKIWEYDERLDNRLEELENVLQDYLNQWDDRIENLDDEVSDIFVEWLEDGTLEQIINHDVLGNKADKEYVDEEFEKVNEHLSQTEKDLNSRGVNILNMPEPFESAVGDGVADDTNAINEAIQNFPKVVFPSRTYRVTDTIKVGLRGKNIQGVSENIRSYGESAVLLYDGPVDRTKSVVLLGNNEVGEEPSTDGSDIVFKNFVVDANKKAGFGIYGTLLTNESLVDNNMAQYALEYNMYFARSWYATYTRLLGRLGVGKGLAFGMPLELQDGTVYNWSVSPEMNNVKIDDVRGHSNGTFFRNENPNTFNPDNENHIRQGYGIGFGIGNGFTATQFLSERNGGVNLYVLTDSQPMKTIRNGYLENASENSGLSGEDRVGMVIEHLSDTGGAYTIENIYTSYTNGGGILFKGNEDSRQVWLRNIQQPRFLKSNSLSDIDLYRIVLKENSFYQIGTFNTDERLAQNVQILELSTRSFWREQINYLSGGRHIVYARLKESESEQPTTGITFLGEEDLTNITRQYPPLTTEWTYMTHVAGRYNQIQQSGTGTPENPDIELKIVTMPSTIL